MSTEDIKSEVASIRRQAAEVRMGVELSKEKDTSKMKNLRRYMARLLTVLQQKSTQAPVETPKKSLSTKTKASKIPAQS